jgi:acyl-CoA thioester hydrolase
MPVSVDPPFQIELRVYWEDTDAGGVVFYANYLKFFERARTEWLRSMGHQQQQLRVEHSVMFVVTHSTLRYLRPARLDDVIAVTVQLEHAGRAQMTVFQQAWRTAAAPRELLAEGTIRVGCVDAATFRPQRIPNSMATSIAPFMTGLAA